MRQVIRDGGPALDRATQALSALFTGIKNDLYVKQARRYIFDYLRE